MMRTQWDDRGLTLIEVLIATLILIVGIAGLLSTFPAAYTNVVASGGETKAVTYAQEKIEDLKNQPFNPGPFDNSGTPEAPEPGYTRSWTITQEAGTTAPNRLARITVTVTWTEGLQQRQAQSVTLETLRLEE
ncbi:MAG: prepilin-type N-terminal cleavage/methylation domain-containing protein [Candidatus Methylomirabilales bacterium]